ncbi:protein ADP-ribosylarginine hydrolase-like protein 1 [Xyrichtys novacula]|uniref:Protein ADP-ribosylarginine hydrolase-like protein 1 n=1 Tax=Xyrichtys novacula TaxID=13765 RepID=A0AAV1EMA0_XYRNO|nr:protein ADP-ribosylarginine hydrolase-like protein 1 [Xyrichtys novacula]
MDLTEKGAAEYPEPTKAAITQRTLPKYPIPCVRKCDDENVDHLTDSSIQSGPQTTSPLISAPAIPCDTPGTAHNTRLVTFKDKNLYPSDVLKEKTDLTPTKKISRVDKEKHGEAKVEVTDEDINDTRMLQSVRVSDDIEAPFKGSQTCAVSSSVIQPERDSPKQRPKYTTVNYGDPSVKQTYKPKVIRFTDTFTF